MNEIIPKEWETFLAKIQTHAPEAIIAGGAVRDWYLSQLPRDIDIFVAESAILPLDEMGLTEIEGTHIESAEHDDSVSCSICFNGMSLPVNIIWCSSSISPMDRFERFDLGICKAAYDGKKVILHNEFLWDVKYNIITLRRASNYDQFIETLKRYQRIKIKYPSQLVIPVDLKLPVGDINV